MVYLFQNEISILTHDFLHITKNLRCVENHAVVIKNYCDGNKMSDRCGTTFYIPYQFLRIAEDIQCFKSIPEAA